MDTIETLKFRRWWKPDDWLDIDHHLRLVVNLVADGDDVVVTEDRLALFEGREEEALSSS